MGLPWVKFDSKTGRVFNKGEDGNPIEVRDLTAVFDFERIQTGWAKFSEGAGPEFVADPDLQTVGQRPAGVDAQGRPSFKRGLKMQIFSAKHLGGAREVMTNSNAVCGAISALYDQYTDAAESKSGNLPVVQVTGWVKADKNGNMRPEMRIVKWVPRPHELSDTDDDFPGNKPAQKASAPAVPPPQRKPASPPPPPADDETEF